MTNHRINTTRRGVLKGTLGASLGLAGASVLPGIAYAEDEIVWGGAVPLTGPFAQAGSLGEKGLRAFVGFLNAKATLELHPLDSLNEKQEKSYLELI